MRSFAFCFFFIFSPSLFSYSLDDYSRALNSLDEEKKELFYSSANRIKCPTCTGLSVLGSETSFSMQIRKKTLELVRDNKTESEIKSYFLDHYGPWIFRAPPKQGFHRAIWLAPVGLLLLLFFLALFFIQRRSQGQERDRKEIEEAFKADFQAYFEGKVKG